METEINEFLTEERKLYPTRVNSVASNYEKEKFLCNVILDENFCLDEKMR